MLEVYTLSQSEEWDCIVRSFKEHDVYWLSGYVKGFALHGDGEPLLFYYSSNHTRGINVVMKRDIALVPKLKGQLKSNTYFDFATPYGYGGWLIEGEDVVDLFLQYESWCQRHQVISEFVRFHPLAYNKRYCQGAYEITELGNIVILDLSTTTQIWEDMTSKNRNMVRKAQKNGIKIYNGRHPGIFSIFKDIYNLTMDKDEAEAYYYFGNQFYQSICDDLAYDAQIFYAELNGDIISSAIITHTNGRLNYHLSGSKREYNRLAPSNLLLYQAALWGSKNDYQTFNLGGGVGSREDSLFKFKKSFYRKDDLRRYTIGRKVFDKKVYQDLVDLTHNEEADYFPRYRG